MLAQLARELPRGDGWRYEPKWDGFRAIVFRDGDDVHIGSRNALPLARYFPEVVETAKRALPDRCVVDGEIVMPGEDGLEFELLQLRLHPAASRVAKLAKEMPATLVVFDLLAEGSEDLREAPLDRRRARLVACVRADEHCFVTPQTDSLQTASRWFEEFEGAGLDGIVAKQHDLRYRPGERVMVKVKHERTIDCVVGGYRVAKDGKGVGALLLGLYADGELQYVGFTSTFRAPQRRELKEQLDQIRGEGFGEGRDPGGPSRWRREAEAAFVGLKPSLVCEVAYDHFQGWRFRHGTRFLRWRADKDPRDCTFEQLTPPKPFALSEIRALGDGEPAGRGAPGATD